MSISSKNCYIITVSTMISFSLLSRKVLILIQLWSVQKTKAFSSPPGISYREIWSKPGFGLKAYSLSKWTCGKLSAFQNQPSGSGSRLWCCLRVQNLLLENLHGYLNVLFLDTIQQVFHIFLSSIVDTPEAILLGFILTR
jgi:hypothetical protein